jgi:hypothetical protein
MKADLKLIKREGDFCIGGVWDIYGLHVDSSWIAASERPSTAQLRHRGK